MSQSERIREPISTLPSAEILRAKEREGWRPVAIEWMREASAETSVIGKHPIPYGLRIAADCSCLEVDPVEKEVMALVVAMIAGDHPLSKIAEELNQRGHFTRGASRWTQVAVFKLLPRIVEFGPEILSADTWAANKSRLLAEVS